jgi:hypothetical protein
MRSKHTDNLTDGEKDIVKELLREFDTDLETPSEEEIEAWERAADREIFAAIDEMYQSNNVLYAQA